MSAHIENMRFEGWGAINADNGVRMFAVGIGENGQVDRMEIDGIASDPDSDYSYVMQNADQLDVIANNILDVICR